MKNVWRAIMMVAVAIITFSEPTMPAQAQSSPVDVNIVAHQDDDSFFMQPDIYNAWINHHTQVTVYITGGNILVDDLYYMHQREQGAMDAYATMALFGSGQPLTTPPTTVHWDISLKTYGGVKVTVANCVEYPTLHLIFLRCPASKSEDGHNVNQDLAGNFRQASFNLRDLYNHPAYSQPSVDASAVYTKSKLTTLLVSILVAWKPRVIRTQDVLNPNAVDFPNGSVDTNGHFYDHSDHYWGSRFAQDAITNYHKNHPIPNPKYWAYRGYNIYNDASTLLSDDAVQLKRWLGFYYSYNDFHMHLPDSSRPLTAYTYPSQYTFNDWLRMNGDDFGFTDSFGPGGWAHHQAARRIPLP